MDNLLQGPTKNICNKALSNEWGILSQGYYHGVASTDTIEFIEPSQIPTVRKVTYITFVCDYRPLKTEPWRVLLLVGVDKLAYGARFRFTSLQSHRNKNTSQQYNLRFIQRCQIS